MASGHPR